MNFFFKIILFLLLLFPIIVFSQKVVKEKPKYSISKTSETINLDGLMNEVVWQKLEIADNFVQLNPYDTSFAALKTEVRCTFDDKNIYFFAKCFQPKKSYRISSYKRDFGGGSSDVFSVNLDTFNDKLNGFHFAVNPYGVQREALIFLGENLDIAWDNKWESVIKNYDEYWTVEMAIPFKSLRFKIAENNTWNMNFGRSVLATNEVSVWAPTPRNFRPTALAYAAPLHWIDNPPSLKQNIALIPYLNTGAFTEMPRDYETLQALPQTNKNTLGIGMDAKVAIGPSLNLDLTINPDFSQVEVDRQQTNLNRFELFFPERRQFFIENSDLFGTFGFPNSRPFFTRRIGIAYNSQTGNNQPVKLQYGARLSGKINNDLRIGLLNAQTAETKIANNNILPSANYSVAILQQKILKRSTIGAVFVNKTLNLKDFTETQKKGLNKYNRTAGVEFNYYSENNQWESETFLHKSFSPKGGSDASSFGHYTGFDHPNFEATLGISRIGDNYSPEVGFTPRNGFVSIFWPIEVKHFVKNDKWNKIFNTIGGGLFDTNNIYDLKGKLLDRSISPFLNWSGPSNNNMYIAIGTDYTYLFEPFDPTNADLSPVPENRAGVVPLPVGGYTYKAFNMGYESSNRDNISGGFELRVGQFFNGKIRNYSGSLNYRFQPVANVSFDAEYNDIKLPAPYNSTKFWLIGPKVELTFNKSLFFTNFFQYNSQTNNFNINSRLQWRFKPVSDIFLVYTDNRFASKIGTPYNINAFTPNNRALVFKVTYWFNL